MVLMKRVKIKNFLKTFSKNKWSVNAYQFSDRFFVSLIENYREEIEEKLLKVINLTLSAIVRETFWQ
jgi:hypothetical protein